MTFSTADRNILRELAKRVAEIAAKPEILARKSRWSAHNSLRSNYPMILVYPEGSWRELIPETTQQCTGKLARTIERNLLMRIYTAEHFASDNSVEDDYPVSKSIVRTGWGLEPRRIQSPEKNGAWHFDPVIKEPSDLKRLRCPEISYDESTSLQKLTTHQELFGDILNVSLTGMKSISYHLMAEYTALRGLEEVMTDMYSEPEMLHDAMAFFTESHRRILKAYGELGLLEFNNDGSYHNSGGNGFTGELPLPDADPAHVRPCDMWGSAEAQELALVSPEHHEEFSLKYERQLLAPFGLTGYGCCEDLSRKLKHVLALPNIRRISISPFADVSICAPQLGNRYIFSWKPQPAHLVGEFNSAAIREYISHAVAVTRENNCILEIILKDTHTCQNHPERFDEWTRIARSVVEEQYPASCRT